jgi:RimJ/RimL family protein N-acetyltransferase
MLVLRDKERIADFLEKEGVYRPFGCFEALGWEGEDGEIFAGAALFDYNGANARCSIAIKNGAAPRMFFYACLAYSFNQLNLRRLTFDIFASNIRSQNLARRLGATLEATLHKAAPDGDILSFVLFPENCTMWRKLQNAQRWKTPSSA